VNEGKQYAPHILNLSFPGRDTDYAVALLDEAGFAVSTKSACEADAEGSRVVRALTRSAARAASTLRISWGPGTSEDDLKSFAQALVRTIRFLDAHRL
jgi:cysteine desulfurase